MNAKKYTGIILAGIMICAVFAAAMPAMVSAVPTDDYAKDAGTATTNATEVSEAVPADGGYITPVNFTGVVSQTSKWQGYYGNISGSINLGDSSGTLKSWTWSNDSNLGYVLATLNGSVPNWSALETMTGSQIDTNWTFTGGDSAANTFTNETGTVVVIAGKTISAAGNTQANTYNANANADKWFTVALTENAGHKMQDEVFVGITNTSDVATAYNDRLCDYQMIVPVQGGGDEYYFYVELL